VPKRDGKGERSSIEVNENAKVARRKVAPKSKGGR
jgi:hypothetical protein